MPTKKTEPALQTDADSPPEGGSSTGVSDPGDTPSEDVQTEPEEKKPKPTLSRQRTRVVPIDERRTVETETDKANNDLLDLLESLRSNRILTDKFHGVEKLSENSNQYVAVLYHGSYRILIPVEETVEPPRDYRGMEPGTVLQYLINKRLGAEVDYIVKGVDQASGVVVASRLEAMRAKRRQY